MCTLPIDIIGKIANYTEISDIVSFLISSKDLSNLINKDLANKLTEIYNLPFVSDFQKFLYYSRLDKERLIQLSVITDDVRLFKAHYSRCYAYLLSKFIPKCGSIKICDYIFETPSCCVDNIDYQIIKMSVKHGQYILVSHLLEKVKNSNSKHYIINMSRNIYSYVRSIKMIKLLMTYLPLDINEA